MPYMRVLSKFRDNVRRLAMNGASPAELLALSDELRDIDLVDLGVAVDDQEGSFCHHSIPSIDSLLTWTSVDSQMDKLESSLSHPRSFGKRETRRRSWPRINWLGKPRRKPVRR